MPDLAAVFDRFNISAEFYATQWPGGLGGIERVRVQADPVLVQGKLDRRWPWGFPMMPCLICLEVPDTLCVLAPLSAVTEGRELGAGGAVGSEAVAKADWAPS